MNTKTGILLLSILWFHLIPAMAIEYQVTTGTSFHIYDSYDSGKISELDDDGFHKKSDDTDKGHQVSVPFLLSTTFKEWSIDLLTAYTYTKAETESDKTDEINAVSDTKLNITYRNTDILPFNADLILCLDVNLPTGKNDLKSETASLFMDSDLFPIQPYGEGYNINPGIVLATSRDKLSVAIGMGYNFRLEYDHNKNMQNYDPGNILILTSVLGYDLTEEWRLNFYGEWGKFSKDKLNGESFHQQDEFFATGVDIIYKKPDWDVMLNLESIIRDEVSFGLSLSESEFLSKDGTSGNEYIGHFVFRKFFDNNVTIKSIVDIILLESNGMESTDDLYFGKRNTVRIGFSCAKMFSPVLEAEAGIDLFSMDADISYLNEEERTYKGITVGATLTRYF